jgi:hypothetical protein
MYDYYYAKQKLMNDAELEALFKENMISTINIGAYEVDTNGKHPFLKYLLVNYFNSDMLFFPQIQIVETMESQNNNFGDNVTSLESSTSLAIEYIYQLIKKNNLNNIEKENIIINGFYYYNNQLFLFMDLTKCKLLINDISKTNNNLWLTTIDDIANTKNLLDMKINDFVHSFFVNNKEFCFLVDMNNNKELYEIPTTVYVSAEESKLQFISTFGVSIKSKDAIAGSFYYFTDYQNALKNHQDVLDEIEIVNGYKKMGSSIKLGIIRFALFLGKIKIIDNSINDLNNKFEDCSIIKTERILSQEYNAKNKNIELLTLRISDHDGNWTEEYDSCFLGKIQLENGYNLDNTPLYIVKEYEQQIPLSFHFLINYTNYLGEFVSRIK